MFELACSIKNTIAFTIAMGTAAVTKGTFVTVGAIRGFILATVSPDDTNVDNYGDQYVVIAEADAVLADKTTGGGTSIAQGALLYLHTNKVSTASTGGTLCGYALEPASTSDTQVLMRFNGAYKALT